MINLQEMARIADQKKKEIDERKKREEEESKKEIIEKFAVVSIELLSKAIEDEAEKGNRSGEIKVAINEEFYKTLIGPIEERIKELMLPSSRDEVYLNISLNPYTRSYNDDFDSYWIFAGFKIKFSY